MCNIVLDSIFTKEEYYPDQLFSAKDECGDFNYGSDTITFTLMSDEGR
jgi:hypothetical protein